MRAVPKLELQLLEGRAKLAQYSVDLNDETDVKHWSDDLIRETIPQLEPKNNSLRRRNSP